MFSLLSSIYNLLRVEYKFLFVTKAGERDMY